MAEAYVGEIRAFAFSYAPQGWLLCQGQQLSVNQYQLLFALISNVYGGDGVSTFNLPDLRGRVPVQQGQGPLGAYLWASSGGTSAVTVNTATTFALSSVNQLPAHSHAASFTGTGGGGTPVQPTIAFVVSNDTATSSSPLAGGYFAAIKPPSVGVAQLEYTATATTGTTTLNAATATASGGSGGGITGGTVAVGMTGAVSPDPISMPVNIEVPPTMAPFVAMNYAICIDGIFPPRP